uniref:Serine aminopeptidase S33 domain-containing protein n=1 Tax=Oryza glumipatula TaxID=40148 RepID=A0A0E0ATK4_9ORYZ
MAHPVAEADEKSPFGRFTAEEFYARHGVLHSTSTFVNPRGLRIFTQRWAPAGVDAPLLGAIAVVHGFTGESSWTVQLTAVHLAKAGFAVAAVDYQGHGFSDGLQDHIPDIVPVLDDCDAAFARFRADYPPPLPCFLYGESLGGAIVLLLHLRDKERWRDGAVLNGAMCGVSPRFMPPWPVEHLLWAVAAVAPTWHLAFSRGNMPDRSFRVPWKRALAVARPRSTMAPPRAATARELLRVCREVQSRFQEVELPLLVVHGGDDTLCDPECAEELHRRAGSEDKTLRVYPGMWHQLVGEPEENVDKVFGDVLDWFKSHAAAAAATPGEGQQ